MARRSLLAAWERELGVTGEVGRDQHDVGRKVGQSVFLVEAQHRPWRALEDVLRGAAEQGMREAGASVCAEDDEIGLDIVGGLQDRVGGSAVAHVELDRRPRIANRCRVLLEPLAGG